jgi:hypothetical protein
LTLCFGNVWHRKRLSLSLSLSLFLSSTQRTRIGITRKKETRNMTGTVAVGKHISWYVLEGGSPDLHRSATKSNSRGVLAKNPLTSARSRGYANKGAEADVLSVLLS